MKKLLCCLLLVSPIVSAQTVDDMHEIESQLNQKAFEKYAVLARSGAIMDACGEHSSSTIYEAKQAAMQHDLAEMAAEVALTMESMKTLSYEQMDRAAREAGIFLMMQMVLYQAGYQDGVELMMESYESDNIGIKEFICALGDSAALDILSK